MELFLPLSHVFLLTSAKWDHNAGFANTTNDSWCDFTVSVIKPKFSVVCPDPVSTPFSVIILLSHTWVRNVCYFNYWIFNPIHISTIVLLVSWKRTISTMTCLIPLLLSCDYKSGLFFSCRSVSHLSSCTWGVGAIHLLYTFNLKERHWRGIQEQKDLL